MRGKLKWSTKLLRKRLSRLIKQSENKQASNRSPRNSSINGDAPLDLPAWNKERLKAVRQNRQTECDVTNLVVRCRCLVVIAMNRSAQPALSGELINTLIKLNAATQVLRIQKPHTSAGEHIASHSRPYFSSSGEAPLHWPGSVLPSPHRRTWLPMAATDPPLRHLGSLQHPFECSRRALKSDN